jgi:exosortase/archaeosortase family protein
LIQELYAIYRVLWARVPSDFYEARIGVVEACSGLSMLLTFVALSTAAALVVKRSLLDRVVLVASSISVALVANIFRIIMTGILHDMVGGHAATTFYHDLAGWIMIPLALFLYWLEIGILSRLLVEASHEVPLMLALVESRRSANTASSIGNPKRTRVAPVAGEWTPAGWPGR